MGFAAVVLVFLVAAAGAVAGTRLAEVPKVSHQVLAVSGGVLIAISLIWVVPETASHQGWVLAIVWVAAGFALIWFIDHFVYPICPSCSHAHHHEACSTPLHGFAAPLLVAMGIHSFLDGWGLALSQQGSDFVKVAFLLGIGLHKLPEGLALGAIVRASLPEYSRAQRGAVGPEFPAFTTGRHRVLFAVSPHWKSLAACIGVEAMTLVGGASGFGLAARMGGTWAGILLAAAAGTFIYLGYHAVEGELRRRVI